MQKPLLPALFVIVLPLYFLVSDYGHQPETIMGKKNQIIEAVFIDSTPSKAKSTPPTKPVKSGVPVNKNIEPKRIKGSIVDTVGVIYELNAF